jgi:hypothetical protein
MARKKKRESRSRKTACKTAQQKGRSESDTAKCKKRYLEELAKGHAPAVARRCTAWCAGG